MRQSKNKTNIFFTFKLSGQWIFPNASAWQTSSNLKVFQEADGSVKIVLS